MNSMTVMYDVKIISCEVFKAVNESEIVNFLNRN